MHPRHLYLIRLSEDLLKVIGNKKVFVDAINAEGIPLYFGYEFPLYKTPAFKNKNFKTIDWYKDIYSTVDYKNEYLKESEKACIDTCWLLHTVLLGNEQDIHDIYAAM